jgi:hypothetical protein
VFPKGLVWVVDPKPGCGCWFVFPNGLVWVVDPKPPKGFWPKTEEPAKRINS